MDDGDEVEVHIAEIIGAGVRANAPEWAEVVDRYRWRRRASRLLDAYLRHDRVRERELVDEILEHLDDLKDGWLGGPRGYDPKRAQSVDTIRGGLDLHMKHMPAPAADTIVTVVSEPEPEHGPLAAEIPSTLRDAFRALASILGAYQVRDEGERGPLKTLLTDLRRLEPRKRASMGSYPLEEIATALLLNAGLHPGPADKLVKRLRELGV